MAEVKWIKIVTDVFDDEKVLLIETLPDADSIIVIWFKLLCLAGKQNNGGVFLMGGRIPYTEEMFATIFRRPLNTVRLALRTFQEYGMVDIIDNTVTIPHWEKHQSLDAYEQSKEKTRQRVAAYRERQKALIVGNVTEGVTVTECNATDKIRKEEIRTDKNRGDTDIAKDINVPSKPPRHKYGLYEKVLLTDEDYEKLKSEFPHDYSERIARLDEYIASTGKKYKNHLATIRSWARKDKPQGRPAVSKSSNPFLDMAGDGYE